MVAPGQLSGSCQPLLESPSAQACGAFFRVAGRSHLSKARGPALNAAVRWPVAAGGFPTESGGAHQPAPGKDDRFATLVGPDGKSIAPALSFPLAFPYIEAAGSPAMEINSRRNKPFGPGGSTRRLHQSRTSRELDVLRARPGRLWWGRNRIDEGVKGVLFPGIVPPLSGYCNSCQRQLCSGCSGCVKQFERPL